MASRRDRVGKASSDRAKRDSMRKRVARTRAGFQHPTNRWSAGQWSDLLRAAGRKRLRVQPDTDPRVGVRLTSPRLQGHDLVVFQSADYPELMRHLA